MIYAFVILVIADLAAAIYFYRRIMRDKLTIAMYDEASTAVAAANVALMQAYEERGLDVAEAKARLHSIEAACKERLRLHRNQLGMAIKPIESRGYRNKKGLLVHSREWAKLKECHDKSS